MSNSKGISVILSPQFPFFFVFISHSPLFRATWTMSIRRSWLVVLAVAILMLIAVVVVAGLVQVGELTKSFIPSFAPIGSH